MFSSLFSTAPPIDPTAQNFHSVTERFKDNELFAELEPTDTELLCANSGFVTETQVWYIITEDGTSIWCQIIHSAVGLWYPTIQFNCKVANPLKGLNAWKSINVSNFVCPPPGHDKRSTKADEFTITHKSHPDSEFPESYTINANLGQDLQVSLELKRPSSAPGYKVGKGPKGGYSYFGPDLEKPEGYVIHRFWPMLHASGHIIRSGKADAVSAHGMFVHAIQGMRPNLVASAWNFGHFHSNELGGVSAIQMEFTTQTTHGKHGAGSGGAVVNIGSLVVGGKLVTVTAETKWPGEEAYGAVVSRATHLDPQTDAETGYGQPSKIEYSWAGSSIDASAPGTVEAKVTTDLGSVETPKGLIEKVDILAEIPYVLKVAVNYVAGTKPYIYQYLNPAKLTIKGPDAFAPGLSGGAEVDGYIYSEATFIS